MALQTRPTSRKLKIAVVATCATLVISGCSDEKKATSSSSNDKASSTTIAQASAKLNLDELLTRDQQWATYYEAAATAQVKPTLAKKGPYTVLVPASESFGDKGTDALGTTPNQLALGVRRHLIEGELTLAKLAALNGKTVTTLSGDQLKVEVVEGSVTVGGVKLIKSDIYAKNGIIHVAAEVIPAPK